MLCTLCDSTKIKLLSIQRPEEFYQCDVCDLIFKSPSAHWDLNSQKTRYDRHQNQIDSPGYVEFFNQLLTPLKPYLKGRKSSLDWGAGPGESPVLSELLKRQGLQVDLYDPIYHPGLKLQKYDLVTATEVIEHFLNPRASLMEILEHLKSGGVFAGLTSFHLGSQKMADWWYVNDPTHVVFYSEKTFHWIAQNWQFQLLHLQNPVFILEKN